MEDKFVKMNLDAYTGNEPYIFISYSHRDTEQVYNILKLVEREKYRFWYDDTMEIGEDFRATKDLDIVLIVESLTAEFGRHFWKYITDAGYEHKNKSKEKHAHDINLSKNKSHVAILPCEKLFKRKSLKFIES